MQGHNVWPGQAIQIMLDDRVSGLAHVQKKK